MTSHVIDPAGLRRCATCQNAFEHDRQPDGRCKHCGGWFDPLVGHHVRYAGQLPCNEPGHDGDGAAHPGWVIGSELTSDGQILTVRFACCGPGYCIEVAAGEVQP